MRGFIATPIVIGIVVLVLIVGGVIFYQGKTSLSETANSTPLPVTFEPSSQPSNTATPSAVVKPTTKPTSKPSIVPSATVTPRSTSAPTPAPTTAAPEAPKTGCAEYDMGGTLGNLKVSLQAEGGQQIVGDAAVTIKRKYEECKGVDPGFPLTQVLSQGSPNTTFSGMRPGPFKIEVMYHGKNFGTDVGISSGDNSTTVTVSN